MYKREDLKEDLAEDDTEDVFAETDRKGQKAILAHV